MGVEDAKNLKLYVRFPEKITSEQQVRDLHPSIVKVILPRQKSARWCWIEVSDKSAAVKALRSKKVIVKTKKVK